MGWGLPLGLSLSPAEVRAVRVTRRGRRYQVAARRAVPLRAGALTSAPQGLVVADEAAVLDALREALALGGRGRDVALALPDLCCLAQVLRYPELQARGEELRALLVWQAADLLPFPPKEARLACQVLQQEGTAGQVALLVAHEPFLAQVEALFARAGAGLLFSASALVCLHNAWDRATGGKGSEALLHLGGGGLGVLLCQDGTPAYARTVPLNGSDAQPAAVLREVEASLDFATEREGLAPPRGLLLAGEGNLGEVAVGLERALRLPALVLGNGVAAWEACWDGVPPTAAEAAAAGAAVSAGGKP